MNSFAPGPSIQVVRLLVGCRSHLSMIVSGRACIIYCIASEAVLVFEHTHAAAWARTSMLS